MANIVSIEDVRNLGTYKVNYLWNLIIASPPAAVPSFPASEQINLRCYSATLPTATVTPIAVSMRAHTVYQQGALNYNGTITLVFNDTVDELISNMLSAWREAIFSTGNGIQNDKLDVEAQIHLELLDRKNQARTKLYKLFGAWPTEYTLPDLESKEGEQIFRPSITIQYDYFDDKER